MIFLVVDVAYLTRLETFSWLIVDDARLPISRQELLIQRQTWQPTELLSRLRFPVMVVSHEVEDQRFNPRRSLVRYRDRSRPPSNVTCSGLRSSPTKGHFSDGNSLAFYKVLYLLRYPSVNLTCIYFIVYNEDRKHQTNFLPMRLDWIPQSLQIDFSRLIIRLNSKDKYHF